MAMLTVRNLPDEVHKALRIRAAYNGRSMEAEVRKILEETVKDIALDDSSVLKPANTKSAKK